VKHLAWSALREGEEAIIEVIIIIIIGGNLTHQIDQSQEEEMESAGFVVSPATQREIVGLIRRHKRMCGIMKLI
jgi:hypothetical protein